MGVGFDITANNTPYRQSFAQLPKIAGDAGNKAGNALAKGLGQARGFSRGIGASLSTFAPALGDAVRESGRLISGLRSGALAGGGMGVAIGAGVLGVGLLAGGWIKIVDLAADYSRELKPLMDKGFLPMAGQQAREAEAGLKSIVIVGKELVVVLGDSLAPMVKETSTTLVALGLMGVDALSGIRLSARELAVFFAQTLTKAALMPGTALQALIKLQAKFVGLLGNDELKNQLMGVSGAWDALTLKIAETEVDILSVSGAYYAGGIAIGDYRVKAEALIGAVGKIGETTTKASVGAKKLGDAIKELEADSRWQAFLEEGTNEIKADEDEFNSWAKATDKIGDILTSSHQAILTSDQQQIASLKAKGLAVEEYALLYGESQLTMAARQAIADESAFSSMQKQQQMRQNSLSIAQDVLSQGASAFSQFEGMEGISKGFVVGQIVLNTALGAAKAIGQLGAVGVPVAALIGAMGVASIAATLLTPAPSKAYAIGATALPDDRLIQAHRDELIVPAPVARSMSEPDRRDLVRGGGGGHPEIIEMDGRQVARKSSSRFRSSPRQAETIGKVAAGRIVIPGRAGASYGY